MLGALPRILHFQRPRDAVLLALGAAILLNSRPFEGAILCLPVAVVLLILAMRQAPRPPLARGTFPGLSHHCWPSQCRARFSCSTTIGGSPEMRCCSRIF